MRLALFDDVRLGVVTDRGITDVTDALEWAGDRDVLTAGWWRRLCRDRDAALPRLLDAAATGTVRPLEDVALRAPVLNPSKIVACASNYGAHVQEMHAVQERTLGGVEAWMMDFDVFLKAPSSISGPAEPIILPASVLSAGHEIHHESELVVVVGTGGRDIPESEALSRVFGYTIGIDVTVRSPADRSRRKSYDTFSPLGPWVTTADEVGDPQNLEIELRLDGQVRQSVRTAEMLYAVAPIVSYASSVMTLLPGDVIFTGAPPGVGEIHPGDHLTTRISRLGHLELDVIAEERFLSA